MPNSINFYTDGDNIWYVVDTDGYNSVPFKVSESVLKGFGFAKYQIGQFYLLMTECANAEKFLSIDDEMFPNIGIGCFKRIEQLYHKITEFLASLNESLKSELEYNIMFYVQGTRL